MLVIAAWGPFRVAALAQTPSPQLADAPSPSLRGGWYPWDPYQYQEYQHGVPVLTGFDVAIERALAVQMGMDLSLRQMAWKDHLAALAAGRMDLAAGATYSQQRDAYAFFSDPYRTETDVLIMRRGEAASLPFRTIEQMLHLFANRHFRLGVIGGFTYADDRVNRFINDPANRSQIVAVGDDAANLRNLLDQRIDGFLADQIAAATTAWRQHQGDLIEEHPLRFSTEIHMMLSRLSQTPQMLARLNTAIGAIKRRGMLNRIAQEYALPVLISQTLDSNWFQLLTLLGTVAFALSGIVLAYAGQYSLFGAVVLASLPAVGGGIVRDLLLQRSPLGVVRDPESLLVVLATVLCAMLAIRANTFLGASRLARTLRSHGAVGTMLIQTFDAVGLAAFSVVGVVVALDTSAQPLWLWGPVSAGITASFGGVMRDLLRHDRLVANLRGELYPEIAVMWGLALALFLQWEVGRLQPHEIRLGVMVAVMGAFLTRMLAIARGIKGWSYV